MAYAVEHVLGYTAAVGVSVSVFLGILRLVVEAFRVAGPAFSRLFSFTKTVAETNALEAEIASKFVTMASEIAEQHRAITNELKEEISGLKERIRYLETAVSQKDMEITSLRAAFLETRAMVDRMLCEGSSQVTEYRDRLAKIEEEIRIRMEG